MEQSPAISWKFHARMISLMLVLCAVDLAFVEYTVNHFVRHGVSVLVMFGFEVRAFFLRRMTGARTLLWLTRLRLE